MGKRENLLKHLPKPVKEFFNSHWGDIWEDRLSFEKFNPKAPYFSYSFWGESGLVQSLENVEQVEDVIRDKLNTGYRYGFDLLICDSEGKRITWETLIVLKKE